MTIRAFDLTVHLKRIGAYDQPGQRRAAAALHHTCGALVLSGLDGHRAASNALVDPHPLDAAGELAAVLTGRGTYALSWTAGRYELDRRDDLDMRRPPSPGRPVLAEHQCGAPLSAEPLTDLTSSTTDYDAPPPY